MSDQKDYFPLADAVGRNLRATGLGFELEDPNLVLTLPALKLKLDSVMDVMGSYQGNGKDWPSIIHLEVIGQLELVFFYDPSVVSMDLFVCKGSSFKVCTPVPSTWSRVNFYRELHPAMRAWYRLNPTSREWDRVSNGTDYLTAYLAGRDKMLTSMEAAAVARAFCKLGDHERTPEALFAMVAAVLKQELSKKNTETNKNQKGGYADPTPTATSSQRISW